MFSPCAGSGGLLPLPPSSSAKVNQLKERISALESKLANAEAKMASQLEIKEYAVQAAKFQTQIEMQKSVEMAYEKGYSRCKESMEANLGSHAEDDA